MDHLTDCPDCGELWQLAATVHGTLGATDSRADFELAEPERGAPAQQRHPGIWATAAALTLTFGLTLISGSNWQRQADQAPVYRSITTPTPGPALQAQVPATLSRSDFRLQWQAPAGVAVDVQLFDGSLNLIFTGYELTGRSVLIPRSRFTGLAAGTTLFWQLEGTVAGSGASVEGSVELR